MLVAKYTEPDSTVFTQLWLLQFSQWAVEGNSYERFINDVQMGYIFATCMSPRSYESLLSRVNPVQGALRWLSCVLQVCRMEERKNDTITWMGVSDIAGAKILKIKGTLNHRALKAIFCPLQSSQSGQ